MARGSRIYVKVTASSSTSAKDRRVLGRRTYGARPRRKPDRRRHCPTGGQGIFATTAAIRPAATPPQMRVPSNRRTMLAPNCPTIAERSTSSATCRLSRFSIRCAENTFDEISGGARAAVLALTVDSCDRSHRELDHILQVLLGDGAALSGSGSGSVELHRPPSLPGASVQ